MKQRPFVDRYFTIFIKLFIVNWLTMLTIHERDILHDIYTFLHEHLHVIFEPV